MDADRLASSWKVTNTLSKIIKLRQKSILRLTEEVGEENE